MAIKHPVDPSNPLCGVWRATEGDTDDYYRSEYVICVEDGEFQVSAVDRSDGEKFEIFDVTWNGVTLSFHSYVPSTARCGINQMRYVGDGKIEFLFTFTEREIWGHYDTDMTENQTKQGGVEICDSPRFKTPLSMPSVQDCRYIIQMMSTSLIDYSYTQPWAEELIMASDVPPAWLCDVATEKLQSSQLDALYGYVRYESTESNPPELEKFAVACIWLRCERRELSWSTFLRMAGEYLDRFNGDWDCGTPYHYLNVYEDAYFTPAAEESTKQAYLLDHDLKPWIEEARIRFAPFLERRRANKAVHIK